MSSKSTFSRKTPITDPPRFWGFGPEYARHDAATPRIARRQPAPRDNNYKLGLQDYMRRLRRFAPRPHSTASWGGPTNRSRLLCPPRLLELASAASPDPLPMTDRSTSSGTDSEASRDFRRSSAYDSPCSELYGLEI